MIKFKSILYETIQNIIQESFKLTFEDKKNIDDEVKLKYHEYLNKVKDLNDKINQAKNIVKYLVSSNDENLKNLLSNNHYMIMSQREVEKPKLYNKFYNENFEEIKEKYINEKSRRTLPKFSYKPEKEKELKKLNFKEYYINLSENDRKLIRRFLKNVEIRVNSIIDRREVRDAFYDTPIEFQKMFSEKPSSYLWRGDYAHPCDNKYNLNNKDYLAMQSFSHVKRIAKDFGTNFTASNIKSYKGSFSIPLFLKYGNIFGYDIPFEELEVMFFDVVYKCQDKQILNINK